MSAAGQRSWFEKHAKSILAGITIIGFLAWLFRGPISTLGVSVSGPKTTQEEQSVRIDVLEDLQQVTTKHAVSTDARIDTLKQETRGRLDVIEADARFSVYMICQLYEASVKQATPRECLEAERRWGIAR